MIAKLTGLLDSTGEDWAILDVAGVGYLVYASARTLQTLPRPGEQASLMIETHVREDHIHLYGFAGAREQELFRLLITVSGVGARGALALLSAHTPEALANAIAAGDTAALARAHGVGKRLAQRIAAELGDKVAGIALSPQPAAADAGSGATGAAPASQPGPLEEAVSALVNLGYARSEAYTAVSSASAKLEADAPLAAVIRAGLRELSA